MKWRFLLLGALLAGTQSPAEAQNSRAARAQAEVSMLVTGTIDIDSDGSVSGYAFDRPGRCRRWSQR